MNNANSYIIKTLKKELSQAILRNNFDLSAPEVLQLSQKLDDLMNPLFKEQLETIILF